MKRGKITERNAIIKKRLLLLIMYILTIILIINCLFIPICFSNCECDRSILYDFPNNNVLYDSLSSSDIATLKKQAEVEGWTFTVGENSATNRSFHELYGFVVLDNWWTNAKFDPCIPRHNLPDAFDWRDIDGVDYTTTIKNQGSCGSCWAFGTVAPLECNIKIKDGIEEDLSEQWLVSCNQDGWGCGGGWWAHDYHQWKTDPCGDTGAVLEGNFPYEAKNAPCDCPYPHDYWIENWSFIGDGNSVPSVEAIKQAIYDYGPVSASVCVNSAFHAYNGGVFNGPSCSNINHAVALVGWDDNQGSNGVWFLRNSWGTGWGEEGYMRIEYGVSKIGYAACYVNYQGIPFLRITLPNGAPNILAIGESTAIKVEIHEINDTYIPGSGKIHYRYDNGTYFNSSLIHLEGNLFEGLLPPPTCNDTPEFYFSVEGENGGIICNPYNAPNSTYSSLVGKKITVFEDDFETNFGWTVENDTNFTDGAWERGIPIGKGDRGDPPTDYDGSGKCFLTDNEDGDSDVDGGITWLISPTTDISAGIGARVDYALWYTNNYGNDPNNDIFRIYISNNDGESWSFIKAIGPNTSMGWKEDGFTIGGYFNPSSKFKVCFEVSDLSNESIVEAGIDAVRISIFESCFKPDLYCNGDLIWTNVEPNDIIEGNFSVENKGEPNSELDWKINKYPDWGTWSFAPSFGNALKPEEGVIIVKVYVKAPNEQNQNFSGIIKLINKENISDHCEIPVSLTTPLNKNFIKRQLFKIFQSSTHRIISLSYFSYV